MPKDPGPPSLTKRIRAISDPDELAAWFAGLSRAMAVLLMRMMLFRQPAPPPADPPTWISLQKAARILDVSPKWLWRHRNELPFMETIDGRRWRVNMAKLAEHMARRR